MQADKIPGEIMREAWDVQNAIHRPEHDGHDAVKIIARALMARDRRAAEIARQMFTRDSVVKNSKGEPYVTGMAAICAANRIAAAILTYGGRDEQR